MLERVHPPKTDAPRKEDYDKHLEGEPLPALTFWFAALVLAIGFIFGCVIFLAYVIYLNALT